MAVLRNPRHERFAQLVATGMSAAEAYVAAGYAEKAAYTCGPRLLKTSSVQARVRELQHTIAKMSIDQAVIDRGFVLRELRDNALSTKQNQQWSASNRALELLGKELGMFQEPNQNWLDWDGDATKLSDEQLEKVIYLMEKMAYGDHEAKILANRRRAGADIGVIDVQPMKAEVSLPKQIGGTEDTEQDAHEAIPQFSELSGSE